MCGQEKEGNATDQVSEIAGALSQHPHTVAIVGLSPNPDRDSHVVAQFLKARGWHIIPVNPTVASVLGEPSYASLDDIPRSVAVDVVDVFRRSDETPPIAEAAVRMGAKVLWMQLGVVNVQAAATARDGGLQVVMDRCLKIELQRMQLEETRN